MSNFDYLQDIPEFTSFSSLCVQAENTINMSPYSLCVIQCRVALEKCIKYIYSRERYLMIYDYNHMKLSDMMTNNEFRRMVPIHISRKMHTIRIDGNNALHNGVVFNEDVAIRSLRDLFDIVQWIDLRYNDKHTPRYFHPSNIDRNPSNAPNPSNDSNKSSGWSNVGYMALGSFLTIVGFGIWGIIENKK